MKNTFKITKIILLILLLSSLKTFAQQERYVGNWLINPAKSNFGNVPLWTSVKQFQMRKQQDTLFLKSVNTDEAGHMDTSNSVYLIGQILLKTMKNNMAMQAKINWSESDHNFLRTATYRDPADNKLLLVLNEIWSLSADGNELTITKSVQDVNNSALSYTTTAVLDKQK
jgi:hypothetical protein